MAIDLWRLVKLTKLEYYADFLITAPVTAFLIYLSWQASFWWPLQFSIGIVVWSLYEYSLHRWFLHGRALRWLHNLHHDDQRAYIALHPFMTWTLYALSWVVFGFHSAAIIAGFSAGYVVYVALHTAFHYADIKRGHPLFRLKRRHAIHHGLGDVNYGIIVSLWDRLFGTERFVAE